MLKHVLYASAALVFLAAPGFADTTVTLTGNVNAVCVLDITSSLTIPLGTIDLNADGSVMAKAYDAGLAGRAWCNGDSNTLTVQAFPLFSVAHHNPDAPFTGMINYTLTTGLAPGQSVTSSITGGKVTAPLSYFDTGNNSISGQVNTISNGMVVAGAYSGIIQISLAPSP